ncbi:MAG TPA: hypothetical protein VJ955_06845 [Desulfuromonadales bacterium]|nr:hypothetical protein [Desulfuromonadales bacterium]
MKSSILVFVLFLCAGCALLPVPPSASHPGSDKAQHLFLQGLDELTATGGSPSFATLHRRHPQSPWTARADQVVKLCAKPAARLKELRNEIQRCSRDKTRLKDQIKHLRDDLDKIKKLLIEMEMRAN